jgi:hypothetical protein
MVPSRGKRWRPPPRFDPRVERRLRAATGLPSLDLRSLRCVGAVIHSLRSRPGKKRCPPGRCCPREGLAIMRRCLLGTEALVVVGLVGCGDDGGSIGGAGMGGAGTSGAGSGGGGTTTSATTGTGDTGGGAGVQCRVCADCGAAVAAVVSQIVHVGSIPRPRRWSPSSTRTVAPPRSMGRGRSSRPRQPSRSSSGSRWNSIAWSVRRHERPASYAPPRSRPCSAASSASTATPTRERRSSRRGSPRGATSRGRCSTSPRLPDAPSSD